MGWSDGICWAPTLSSSNNPPNPDEACAGFFGNAIVGPACVWSDRGTPLVVGKHGIDHWRDAGRDLPDRGSALIEDACIRVLLIISGRIDKAAAESRISLEDSSRLRSLETTNSMGFRGRGGAGPLVELDVDGADPMGFRDFMCRSCTFSNALLLAWAHSDTSNFVGSADISSLSLLVVPVSDFWFIRRWGTDDFGGITQSGSLLGVKGFEFLRGLIFRPFLGCRTSDWAGSPIFQY